MRYELIATCTSGYSEVQHFSSLDHAIARAMRYQPTKADGHWSVTIKDKQASHDATLPNTDDQIVWRAGAGRGAPCGR